ncbi:Sensor histidine kinase YehU [Phaeobacter piscinae]|uniref:sensor histidine kinase n=1 Tax=Phaeobacter piscinae TaxID=1580596 RepID=UPI000C9C7EE7|nr:histidine kinase [Phaeobacter piscinae]AUR36525.1 Sensor histidine kinase YehU [Phaeobacter piscinae]
MEAMSIGSLLLHPGNTRQTFSAKERIVGQVCLLGSFVERKPLLVGFLRRQHLIPLSNDLLDAWVGGLDTRGTGLVKKVTFGLRSDLASFFALAAVLGTLAVIPSNAATDSHAFLTVNTLLRAVLAAFLIFVIRPRYLKTGRLWHFVWATFFSLLFFAIASELLEFIFLPNEAMKYALSVEGPFWTSFKIWIIVLSIFSVLAFSDSAVEQGRVEKLKRLEKTAQLTALRQQINPHTLLNGLNNIYAISIAKSPLAAKSILDLSNILRYSLYEADADCISLERDIEVLKMYISFQELGLEDRIDVDFEILGRVQDYKIAPLILLPIVENAFKHGANIDNRETIKLFFKLRVERGSILFESRNPREIVQCEPVSGGVGMDNIRSRLELAYRNRYDLEVEQTDSVYCLRLALEGEPQ